MRIAILASGNGTNAQAIIDKAKAGILDVEIAAIISDRPQARVLERGKLAGIATRVFEKKSYLSRPELDSAIASYLESLRCEAIVLAGYMLILGKEFVQIFKGRIINLHPALLPAFPGAHAIRDAFNYGARITGVSVHFVEEEVDAGPLIIQAAIPIRTEETLEALEARVHDVEHRIFPQALQWLATNRLRLEGRRVILDSCGCRIGEQPDCCLVSPPLEDGF